jgi:phospholipid/cholesterol/gamma-HCH transport system substrate-binding protein
MRSTRAVRIAATGACIMTFTVGCGFQGLNSLPLPGAVGRGAGASMYYAQVANVGTLEPNSPVLVDDVVVGSITSMTFDDWHVNVEFAVRPGVTIPVNAVARVGQTSLLGSMHLAVDPPAGETPTGRLSAGTTIPLSRSATYPSTEQTLSALSVVVNGGGLGQIGDVIHSFNEAFGGHENQIRDLLTRLDDFVGVFDRQRDKIVATISSLNRLAGTLAAQNQVITEALHKIPPALDVLIRERPTLISAMDKLRNFSDTSVAVINDTQEDLVKNLQNMAPTFRALADVGPNLAIALGSATTFPQAQDTIDRGIKGDYMNLFGQIDLTIPRLKRTMFLGTRWGDNSAQLIPAPGEPYGTIYTKDPLGLPLAPPADAPPSAASLPQDGSTVEIPAPQHNSPEPPAPATEPASGGQP